MSTNEILSLALIAVVFVVAVLFVLGLHRWVRRKSLRVRTRYAVGLILIGGLVGARWLTEPLGMPAPPYRWIEVLGHVFLTFTTVMGASLLSGD